MIVSGVSQETNVTDVAEARENAGNVETTKATSQPLQKGHTGRKFEQEAGRTAAPHRSGLSKVLPPLQQALRHLLSVQRKDQVITPITVNMEIARA